MSYIGSAINLARRLRSYFSLGTLNKELLKGNSRIHSALLKYGYSNFSLDILEYCEPNILISREQYYIDLFKPEYNILKVAGNRLGFKHSEETKVKIGINQRGANNHNYGKTLSYETRKMISESLKSIIRPKNKFRIVTSETRLKLSLRSHGIPVEVYDELGNLFKKFPSMTSAALYFKVSDKTIKGYLNKDKFYKGYGFKSNFKS